MPNVPEKARELLAEEFERAGWPREAVDEVRSFTGKLIDPALGPALRALTRALNSWEPIASAPKDGRLIFLCWPNWDDGVRVSRWLSRAGKWAWNGSHGYRETVGEPSYWMPIPSLPPPPGDHP
jgi:hypothetical protein